MAIRTKEECHETSISQKIVEICEVVPIIDWKLYPQNPKLSVSNNPQKFVQNIQVPELQYIYPTYNGFRFVITIMNSSPENWVNITSPKLDGNSLNLNPGENVDLTYTFQNLDLLQVGITQLALKCQAYGVKNGIETELDNEKIEGILEMFKADSSGSTISTNREIFNLSFNKANNILSGDKEIIIYSTNQVGWESQPFDLNVSKNQNQNSTSLILSLDQTSIEIGNYSEQMIIKADGKQKRVTINLAVVNDANQFYVSQDYFDFTLLLSENKNASGTIFVDNPNSLSISLESFPGFLTSCSYANNSVTFQSKSATQLGVGLFSGNIVLKAGDVQKTIFVKINVVEHIVNDFNRSGYYFALDKNKVAMTRVNPLAVKVFMKLDMFFMGYGKMYNETQVYQLPYFQNKAVFYPGDEVNDFFVKQRSIQDFTTSFDAYQFAVVKMTFSEINEADEVMNSFILDNVRFAPGYKPKCFPFYTDFPVRSVTSNSRLAIAADMIGYNIYISNLLRKINQMSRIGYNVRSILFDKKDLSGNDLDLGKVKLVPIPDQQKVVNIYFETHNLVFDWFSCAGDYELPTEFEHTVSDNVESGSEEKFETKQTDNLTINTGWILHEETEVIDAIFNSNFVIIQLPEKTVRAIPTAKKNNLGTSKKGFKSMMLEFKILKDER